VLITQTVEIVPLILLVVGVDLFNNVFQETQLDLQHLKSVMETHGSMVQAVVQIVLALLIVRAAFIGILIVLGVPVESVSNGVQD